MFDILMGIPDMKVIWDDLRSKKKAGSLTGDEKELFKKFGKAIQFLASDPRHQGLQTHAINPLSRRYGQKVFQSYLGKGTTRGVCFGSMVLQGSRLQSLVWSHTRKIANVGLMIASRCQIFLKNRIIFCKIIQLVAGIPPALFVVFAGCFRSNL